MGANSQEENIFGYFCEFLRLFVHVTYAHYRSKHVTTTVAYGVGIYAGHFGRLYGC